MKATRTPDERFQLGIIEREYPYVPKYCTVSGDLRMAYIDEGVGPIVIFLHGEPSWSFLYRHMIKLCVAGGCRVLAPDLIGFGRSDKPTDRSVFTYERHTAWLGQWFDAVVPPSTNVVLFVQDWGGLLGLRLVASMPERFAAVIAANTGLPNGDAGASKAFLKWLKFSQTVEVLPVGMIVSGGTANGLSEEAVDAYDAPFASEEAKAGARQFPALVPTSRWHPGAAENRAFWSSLRNFDKPFVTCFSDADPVTAGGDLILQKLIKGAQGQKHVTIQGGGHFLQEDRPDACSEVVLRVVASVGGRARL